MMQFQCRSLQSYHRERSVQTVDECRSTMRRKDRGNWGNACAIDRLR
ncbi:MAG: hypothetical protein JGK17_16125 [Microcoleus sp. PH2017_10_PVI_O_A]|nr:MULTISPECIES: hypothetical protein [unclassified Microcoleus]MCC3407087.1 hypothetical protein [Microcoleus sp. PH2017_10_PVI_O_A]MCC3461097.1 hypothetical protein [Microcoleus sp. PH2017_11_PCY_U_A]MCC3479614.1 hypothetical protein [Microcoleus sp. PH2017_12_PCY_D_A]MCC3560459.1 hypothetical protein [Microcoleus sp. PH2017_27_LUM_O_A]